MHNPLYTSNQNQYFLHRLAGAGLVLERDWLANTLDPTPGLQPARRLSTYRFLHLEVLFYGYYALLMGIYLFSLLGIASLLFKLRDSWAKTLLFLALVIAVHSAALRFALSRVIGINWTYVLEDGVADQRMLGPVFQPSAFGVLLLLSIYLFLLRRPTRHPSATLAASIIPPTCSARRHRSTCGHLDRGAQPEKPLALGRRPAFNLSHPDYVTAPSAAPRPKRPPGQEILVTSASLPCRRLVVRRPAVVKILLGRGAVQAQVGFSWYCFAFLVRSLTLVQVGEEQTPAYSSRRLPPSWSRCPPRSCLPSGFKPVRWAPQAQPGLPHRGR
jgi:hypothetical protein